MNLDELKATVLKPYQGARQDRLQALTHLDAGEAAFFQLQLTYIEAQQHAVKHKPLRAALFIPVTSEAPTGADTIEVRYYDLVGKAKVVHDYSQDFPAVTTYGTKKQIGIRSLGAKFQYSVQDIRKSQMSGTPLDQREAEAARRSIDEALDSIAWTGDSASGLTGLINAVGVNSFTIPANGTGTSTLHTTKTPDQIIADFIGLISTIRVATNGKEIPDTILVPQSNYLYYAGTRLGSYNDKSLLTYLKDTLAVLGVTTIDWVNELANAGTTGNIPAGNTAQSRIVAYRRDPSILRLEVPQPFEMFPPQMEGLVYTINCHLRTAGVIVYYPLAIGVADGV